MKTGFLARMLAGVLLAGVLLGGLYPAQAQPAAWTLVNEYPASSLAGEADSFFAEAVNRELAGKLAIKPVFDAASGLRSKDQLKAVAAGRFAMASTVGGTAGDDSALLLLSSLPFLTVSAERSKALFELARPAYDRVFAAMGQRLLYVSPWPPSGLWTAAPLADLATLKALKVRTYDKTGTEVFAGAGIAAAIVSFADLNPKLESGEINAVLSSGDGGAGRGLWKYLRYFTDVSYAIPLSFATVNLEAWKALDAAGRIVVERIAGETTAHQWRAMDGRVESNFARMRASGMTIAPAPPAEVAAALRSAATVAIDDWVMRTGPEGSQILAAFRARYPR
jgi:TRAP-type C4-dicarboxylate transport system substrate-binding protein